jgi:hypothetical protein
MAASATYDAVLVWRAERVGMIAGSTFVIKSIGGDEGGMLPKSVEWQHY